MGGIVVSPNPKRHKVWIDAASGQIIDSPFPDRLGLSKGDPDVENITRIINGEAAEMAKVAEAQKAAETKEATVQAVVSGDDEIAQLEARIEALKAAKIDVEAKRAARVEELRKELAELEK